MTTNPEHLKNNQPTECNSKQLTHSNQTWATDKSSNDSNQTTAINACISRGPAFDKVITKKKKYIASKIFWWMDRWADNLGEAAVGAEKGMRKKRQVLKPDRVQGRVRHGIQKRWRYLPFPSSYHVFGASLSVLSSILSPFH